MPTLTSATARVEIALKGAELTSFTSLASGLEYWNICGKPTPRNGAATRRCCSR